MKKFVALILISLLLNGCNLGGRVASYIPDFITDSMPFIIKKIDEFFPSLSKYLPQKAVTNKNTLITNKFHIYHPAYLNTGIRMEVLNMCDSELTKEICDEISTWEIPDGIFETEPTYEDIIGYHLSCVSILRIKNIDEKNNTTWKWGTGFYYDKNKLITNNIIQSTDDIFVMQFTDYIEMTLDSNNGVLNIAKLLKSDPENNIAVLETKTENFSKCEFSNESPDLLSEAIAIGHPKGLAYSVSKGDIKAYRNKEKDLILNKDSLEIYSVHIDSPFYTGSSGGPLFYKGKVIGINYADDTNKDLSFSIHFNVAKKFIK